MELEIKKAGLEHQFELLKLYKRVADAPDAIIRNGNEINDDCKLPLKPDCLKVE